MRKKIIATLTTAGLVAGVGTTAVIVSTPGLALAEEESVAAPQVPGDAIRPGGLFAALVEDGVLDEEEVVEVQEALQALRDTAREEGDLPEHRPGVKRGARAGFQLHGLLEDGVIDADEIAGLPDDSPILDPEGPFAPYLEDGKLSADDLEELKAARESEMAERREARTAAVAEALAGLVDDGALTTNQVDAILEAMATERTDRPRPVRQGMRAGWEIAGLLEDGVIDASELAELPDGHPFNDPDGPAAEYLDDGQLTKDELIELRSQFRPGGRSGPGPDGIDA
jgi:hypothetical protein